MLFLLRAACEKLWKEQHWMSFAGVGNNACSQWLVLMILRDFTVFQ